MKNLLPESLKKLAKLFEPFATLYVVGGAVRNSLLGFPISDFDITSKLQIDIVERLLSESDFKITAQYKRTGTLVIKCGNESFEYTTFRQDSYPLNSGKHKPSKCIFTDNIEIDASRRDFTCNALYYDICKDKIVDLVGGIEDIKNKILRTVRDANLTLSEDALRIMRLVRFRLQLGFGIDNNTLSSAKEYSVGLKDISKERIKDELVSIFEGIFKYDSYKSGLKASDGIRLLVDIGAMKYIIPELLDTIGVAQNPKYHIYDVFEHSLATMDNLPPHLMIVGLLHDIAKPIMLKEYGNMYMHEIRGAELVGEILTRLKFSNAEIERAEKLTRIHMFDLDGKTRTSKCRVFIADNLEYFDDFIALKQADGLATNKDIYDGSYVKKLIQLKNQMLADGMPMKVKDLPINGIDLMELGFSGREIGEMLNNIRLWILHNGKIITREEIFNRLRRRK